MWQFRVYLIYGTKESLVIKMELTNIVPIVGFCTIIGFVLFAAYLTYPRIKDWNGVTKRFTKRNMVVWIVIWWFNGVLLCNKWISKGDLMIEYLFLGYVFGFSCTYLAIECKRLWGKRNGKWYIRINSNIDFLWNSRINMCVRDNTGKEKWKKIVYQY